MNTKEESIPKAVRKCIDALNSSKTDNEKFASLFIVTKLIKADECTEECLKLIYEAIGFQFLNRLLMSTEAPEGCPSFIYKSVALSIVSSFCSVPDIVNSPDVLGIIPVLIDIVCMSDADTMEDNLMLVSDCYTCLRAIAGTESGRKALLIKDAASQLAEVYIDEMFRHDEALNLVIYLVSHQGSEVFSNHQEIFLQLLSRLSSDFVSESTEKKFEFCQMLSTLLGNNPPISTDDLTKEEWPKSVLLTLEGILCSKIGTAHRDLSLQLIARLLELLGIAWGLSIGPNPRQFLLLLVNLACVEVRMKLEERSLEQILETADVLIACYSIIELFVAFMITQAFLSFDPKQREQAYCALKGAVSAILTLLNQEAESNPEWTGDYRDKKTQFIVASIRILGAWLAEESSSMKEEVCNVLPYIISICSRLFQERQNGSMDVGDPLRFMLPAFCHLAAESASRKIMLKENVHQLLYNYFLYQWTIFSEWLAKQPNVAADWLHTETEEEEEMSEKMRPDSEAAVILVSGIYMNIVVLEPRLASTDIIFSQLLKFCFNHLPQLVKRQDFVVLMGNIAVLGLLILRQHSWKYTQGDSAVFRYIQGTVSFLWDAHNSEESCDSRSLVISLRYKKDWPDLAELWFLGMQCLSNVMASLSWVVEFIVDSGWPQEMMKSLSTIVSGAIDASTRTAYEDFLCCLIKADPKIKVLLCKQWNMPESAACKTCDTFLEHFRKCPDDCLNELDEWRTFLWTSALNQDYKHLAAEVHERWKRIRGRHFTFQSQVVILLQTLRQHYKIALITNGPSHAQWEKIAHLEAVELFDTIIVSGDLAYEKPQPEIFHLACRRLQVRPDKCAMVGDRFETDIIGSQLAGLAASIWIPLNSNSNSQEVSSSSSPVVTISQLGELSSLFDIFKTDSKESIHPV